MQSGTFTTANPAEDFSVPYITPAGIPVQTACRVVRQIVVQLTSLFDGRTLMRSERRRQACHIRQIAMYVCHVVLQISMQDIAKGYGRDAGTVSHACNIVEDRRDDRGYDDFVAKVERITTAVFGSPEFLAHD